MINVNDMSLEEKFSELQENISKARVGANNPGSAEYSFLMQCKLGNNRDERLNYLSNLIKNSRVLLSRLDRLDYDIKQQSIRTINKELDEALLLFPSYTKEQENTSRRGFGM